jgi:FKBP-type peptidyl-prolyl cis-trans isomerase (trigger factor)
MSQSQVVSFRASGHFLNWIESQKLEGESVSQAAQRILKEVSGVSGNHKLYTPSLSPSSTRPVDNSTVSAELSTFPQEVSTPNVSSFMSTQIVDTVDKLVTERLDTVRERMAAMEERLGKLRA